MYGLKNENFDFLVDKCLLQVCFGENDLQLNIEGNISITITSSLTITDGDFNQQMITDFSTASAFLLSILGKKIIFTKNVIQEELSSIIVCFLGGKEIHLHDDSKQYESITINHNGILHII